MPRNLAARAKELPGASVEPYPSVVPLESVNGGTLARTTAFFASPAHAMVVRLTGQADPSGDATAVGSFFFDAVGALVGELKVRIDERTPPGANEIAPSSPTRSGRRFG